MVAKILEKYRRPFAAALGTVVLLLVLDILASVFFEEMPWSPTYRAKWIRSGEALDPQYAYAFLFDLFLVETLPYFLTGLFAFLFFRSIGTKLALLVCFLHAAFVAPIDGPTPEGEVIRWLMTYIRIATVVLGISVSQVLVSFSQTVRRVYTQRRQ